VAQQGGGMRAGAQALEAHQHTFLTFKKNFIQNIMPKNVYFLEKRL